ncbi:DUF4838 domain-containing protein [Bacteroides thetaiotaomicron]|uniref:DUF4838 domain-containing protein n=1 Tax=Bacteroides thetaiotaomicron TaxID=818 RepID=UPI0039C45229
MKHCIAFIVFLLVSFHSLGNGFMISKNQKYIIYIKQDSPKLIHYAANEMADYLAQTTGALCKVKGVGRCANNQLVVKVEGENTLAFLSNTLKASAYDEYMIQIDDSGLTIEGGNARGVLYGVYAFLEDFLQCRWYSSEVRNIPFSGTTRIKPCNIRYKSPVKWREVFYYELCDSYIAGILKLNGNAQRQNEIAPNRFTISGGNHAGWGYWCHSLYSMVSPSLYNSHPEYFPEIKGRRIAPAGEEGGTQLCLTNPDVLKLSIEKLRNVMNKPVAYMPIWADSTATYWSVSQMDGNGNCTCDECKYLDEYDGSPSGSILNYVNKIANEFPDKKIATLAYIYSRKAPRYTKPASNVAIQLCAIETARDGINLPIASSPIHATFRKDMQEWKKICNDIIIWDYIIQFQNLISPFPNFSVMQDNIRFYVENNATGIFCQGNREKGGEFAELRGYLLSKLLWNPDCDFQAHMKDFLNGYYGAAGPYLYEYIKMMEAELKKSGRRLSMDGEPESHKMGYLSEECVKKYNELFDKAEKSVWNKQEVLARVQKERMGLMYVQLRLEYGSLLERRKVLQRLMRLAEANDVWMFSEVDWRKDQSGNREMFYQKYMNRLNNESAK